MKLFRLVAAGTAAALVFSGQAGMAVCASQSAETEASNEALSAEKKVVREGTDSQGISWVEREYPLKTSAQPDEGTITLRFYEDMPNVPYIFAPYFHELAGCGDSPEVTKEQEGVYQMTSENAQAVVDTNEEVLSFDDYYAFTDTSGPSEETKVGELLDGAPFARYAGVEAEPGAGKLSFEYAGYGIDLRGDEEGPYLPFTTLASLYEDTSFLHRALYNTEEVVFSYDQDNIWVDQVDEHWYDPILKMKERPADLAAYSYSQLCFSLEHFYGYPGSERIDETIMKEQGLDAALKAYGEMGENAARLLQSTDMAEYFAGSERLRMLLWDGDHTNIDFVQGSGASINPLGMELFEAVGKIDQELDDGYIQLQQEYLMKDKSEQSIRHFEKQSEREKALGTGTYFARGNTAFCVFDEFKLNKKAWDAYYADEKKDLDAFLEKTTDDSLAILLSALRKAQADPQITNFVIDMTMNLGGNDGTAAALESLLTGVTNSPMIDMLTGQYYEGITEVDRNFDGVFDEKDDEVSYDFHFAILLGSEAYSNGTIAPSVLQENGILSIGERTRGGCCCLQFLSTAEGLEFLMSSSRTNHVRSNRESINDGIEPEIELYKYDEDGKRVETEHPFTIGEDNYSLTVPDYSLFYDIEYLGSVIDDYYAKNG